MALLLPFSQSRLCLSSRTLSTVSVFSAEPDILERVSAGNPQISTSILKNCICSFALATYPQTSPQLLNMETHVIGCWDVPPRPPVMARWASPPEGAAGDSPGSQPVQHGPVEGSCPAELRRLHLVSGGDPEAQPGLSPGPRCSEGPPWSQLPGAGWALTESAPEPSFCQNVFPPFSSLPSLLLLLLPTGLRARSELTHLGTWSMPQSLFPEKPNLQQFAQASHRLPAPAQSHRGLVVPAVAPPTRCSTFSSRCHPLSFVVASLDTFPNPCDSCAAVLLFLSNSHAQERILSIVSNTLTAAIKSFDLSPAS